MSKGGWGWEAIFGPSFDPPIIWGRVEFRKIVRRCTQGVVWGEFVGPRWVRILASADEGVEEGDETLVGGVESNQILRGKGGHRLGDLSSVPNELVHTVSKEVVVE